MIVGAFDGLDADPETILSALLDYSRAYWGEYNGGPQVAQHGKIKVDGSPPPVVGEIDPDTMKLKDPGGEWFKERDDILRSAGLDVRRAVHQITVDRHWFPDANADWADGIINRRKLDKRKELLRAGRPVPAELSIVGRLDCEGDWAMLELARRGAMALVGEKRKMAA
jgi:hypothetical protein